MSSSTPLQGQEPAVDIAEVAQSSRIVGPNFHVVAPEPLRGPALRGRYHLRVLRKGLVLHGSDAVDLHDLVTRVEQQPSVTVQVFLKGTVDATVGGRRLLDPPDGTKPQPLGAPRAVMVNRIRPEVLERRGRKGDHMRKVSLTMSPDWLADCGLLAPGGAGGATVERFCGRHLERCCWTPGPRMTALALHMLKAAESPAPLAGLLLESQALEMLAEAFGTLTSSPGTTERGRVEPRDLRRLRRVEEHLEAAGGALVSLEDLSRSAGVSVSTLQRLFQAVHGMSAFEFIRRRNLERARVAMDRDGLSVKEAAFLAGYSSPANFSTAFRKLFGRTPRQGLSG